MAAGALGSGLGGPIQEEPQSAVLLVPGNKEKSIGFFSGGGVYVTPSYKLVVHPGVIPIS